MDVSLRIVGLRSTPQQMSSLLCTPQVKTEGQRVVETTAPVLRAPVLTRMLQHTGRMEQYQAQELEFEEQRMQQFQDDYLKWHKEFLHNMRMAYEQHKELKAYEVWATYFAYFASIGHIGAGALLIATGAGVVPGWCLFLSGATSLFTLAAKDSGALAYLSKQVYTDKAKQEAFVQKISVGGQLLSSIFGVAGWVTGASAALEVLQNVALPIIFGLSDVIRGINTTRGGILNYQHQQLLAKKTVTEEHLLTAQQALEESAERVRQALRDRPEIFEALIFVLEGRKRAAEAIFNQ